MEENKQNEQVIKGIMYKEDDINMLLKMLMDAKIDFNNVELFCAIKKVLLSPIPFEVMKYKD